MNTLLKNIKGTLDHLDWCPSTALHSSPYVTPGLLVFPLHSWYCAGERQQTFLRRHVMDVPSGISRTTCGTGMNFTYCLMLSAVTTSLNKKLYWRKIIRRDKKSVMVCSHHPKKHSSFEGLFDVASSVTSCYCLLYPSKWNGFLTGETDFFSKY